MKKVLVQTKSGQQTLLHLQDYDFVCRGTFGTVDKAVIQSTQEKVAIKSVLQDKKYKNRELQIMKQLKHKHVVELKYFYYSEQQREVYLNLIMEFLPLTIHHVLKTLTLSSIRVYTRHLFLALEYIHSMQICHRDIKPQNLLVDQDQMVLKLCDFGSAKQLSSEQNVSYICSRYYRAPELIFGATDYTVMVDVWSSACVVAEMFLLRPVFKGESGLLQLTEIVKVLGAPTSEDIASMNPKMQDTKFPNLESKPLQISNLDALDFVQRTLKYNPKLRLSAQEALKHRFLE